ncbi:uncharacterized protein LOC122511421 [Leptopilina heterotoma]|uniref:uncharacterized protein LOC122511421 n=1 Tax=Leptopilina heterotoma TaxID=63436 RepID=UPI001CA9BF24|nr:uncharacterized protein LOC122511421 [Leptopilina heterotoma]
MEQRNKDICPAFAEFVKHGNKTCQTFCTDEGLKNKSECIVVTLNPGACYCKQSAFRVPSVNQCISREECVRRLNEKKNAERKQLGIGGRVRKYYTNVKQNVKSFWRKFFG